MYTYTYIYVLSCAATCRTRSFASCPSRSYDAEIFKCCTPPLCAPNPERSRPPPRAPLASGCSGGITTYSKGPIGVGLPVCLRAWGTFITCRAVVQASGCNPSAVAAREDRRPPEPEEPVCRCAQSALHPSRPRRATVRRRFIDRCNLTKLPDSICDLTISSLCVRPPVGVGIQCVQRALHRRDVSKNALRELPECVCKMGNLMSHLTSLYAPS
jgi:hypothetical protein